jgi:hypothetical protein
MGMLLVLRNDESMRDVQHPHVAQSAAFGA